MNKLTQNIHKAYNCITCINSQTDKRSVPYGEIEENSIYSISTEFFFFRYNSIEYVRQNTLIQ